MFTDPSLSLSGQIFWIVDGFLKTLGPEACKLRVGLMSCALWNRLRKFERRFYALYRMWKTGTLPKPRIRTSSPSPLDRAPIAQGAMGPDGEGRGEGGATPLSAEKTAIPPSIAFVQCPARLLPRAVAWMSSLLPQSAGSLRCRLDPLLREHPEMLRFGAECPQVGRLLRPICRMVGLKLPDYLALPKRKRVRKKKPLLPPHPLAARFPDTPAARSAARALAREQAGLPVNFNRLSAVARDYFLHPRLGNDRPLPEIGYGGRSFRPLPKDYVRPKDWD